MYLSRISFWFRLTAWIVILSLAIPHSAQSQNALSGINSAQTFGTAGLNEHSAAPSQISAAPDIWIIEDAHSSLGAQRQIARIIDVLEKFEPRSLIGLEGHSGKIDADFLKAFPDSEIRRAAAYKLLKESRISAAEYSVLTASGKRNILGIEDSRLYRDNWETYGRLLRQIEINKPGFRILETLVSRLEKDVLSEKLQRWVKILHSLDALEIKNGENWEKSLVDAQRRLRATGLQSQKLEKLLSRKISPESETPQTWLSEINGVIESMIRMEANSPLELRTVRFIEQLRRIDKIMKLKASRSDFLETEPFGESFFESILDLSSELAYEDYSRLFPNNQFEQLQSHLSESLSFYRVAIQRENSMAGRLLTELKNKKLRQGILVAGGFHTAGLENIFRRAGKSVLILQPKNFSAEDDRGYSRAALSAALKNDSLKADFMEMLYAMVGAAVIKGYNIETLKRDYLAALTETPKKAILPSQKKSPPSERKVKTNRTVNAVNTPTALSVESVPSKSEIQMGLAQVTVLKASKRQVTLSTPAGPRTITASRRGFQSAAAAAPVRSGFWRFALNIFIGGILLFTMSACSSLQSVKKVPITQSPESVAAKVAPIRFELPPLEEPSLPLQAEAASPQSFEGLLPLPSNTRDDLFTLAGSESALPQAFDNAAKPETATNSAAIENDYAKLPRIKIVSPLTKLDSCPLCNAMTAKEMQKLKDAGAVGEMNPYTIDYPTPEEALAALKDKKKSWVDRYKAIINLTVHQEKKGLLLAHDILRSTTENDPYGFFNGESVRILRANAAQWMVMVGPNSADLETLIQNGLNDPDNLVRYMSAEALRKAAEADPEGKIFNAEMRQRAGSRLISISREDPDLFARYASYSALGSVIGKDEAVRFIRDGLEFEKDYYVLKAIVAAAANHPSESYTEGLLEILKRQPPEKTPGLMRAYGELKLQVRGVLIALLKIDAFHDGVHSAIKRKLALNDMFSVTVGIKESLHEYVALLIEAEGAKDTAETLRGWIGTGRGTPLRSALDQNDPIYTTAAASQKNASQFQEKVKASSAEAFNNFMGNAFLEDKRINTAFLGEVLVSPGMHRDFRVIAAQLLGQHLAVDSEKHLVAAVLDQNPEVVTAALNSLIQIEIWKLESGFSAYDSEFTQRLTDLLLLMQEGKKPLRSGVFPDWNPAAQLVRFKAAAGQADLIQSLIDLLQGRTEEEKNNPAAADPAPKDSGEPPVDTTPKKTTPPSEPDQSSPKTGSLGNDSKSQTAARDPILPEPELSPSKNRASGLASASNPAKKFLAGLSLAGFGLLGLLVSKSSSASGKARINHSQNTAQKKWLHYFPFMSGILWLGKILKAWLPGGARAGKNTTGGAGPVTADRITNSTGSASLAADQEIPPSGIDRRAALQTLAYALSGLAFISVPTPSAQAAPWTPITPKPAADVPARFGREIKLTENDLWAAIERNLDVKMSALELWRQEAEGARLKPSWNIEILGGISGKKPVIGANAALTSPYEGTINLSGIYESKGLTLAADFVGALLGKVFGTKNQAKELQTSLVLSIYHKLQNTILQQYEMAAELVTELWMKQQEMEILRAAAVSYQNLLRLPLNAAPKPEEAMENRQSRIEIQAALRGVQAELQKITAEQKQIAAKLLPLLSDSTLDAGKPISIELDFESIAEKAAALLKNGDSTYRAAALKNPSILSANQAHAAAQQALSLFDRTKKATLNLAGVIGTQRKNEEAAMTGPVFHDLAGMPLDNYGAQKTETGLRFNIPFGGEITADRAQAEAQVRETAIQVDQTRQNFAANYIGAFRSLRSESEAIAAHSAALAEFRKIAPGGIQYNPQQSIKMRLEVINDVRMTLMKKAAAKAALIRSHQKLTALGAHPFPWEKGTSRSEARNTSRRTYAPFQKLYAKLAALGAMGKNSQITTPPPIPFAAMNRAHVVDAALLSSVNDLVELVKSNPSAFWIFLFDENDSSKKKALTKRLRHLSNFKGILIQSANPYADAENYLLQNKITADSIAVGMDERVMRLQQKNFRLRIHAGQRFWNSEIGSSALKLEALRLIFGTLPPVEMQNPTYEMKTYLSRAFEAWQNQITAQARITASA